MKWNKVMCYFFQKHFFREIGAWMGHYLLTVPSQLSLFIHLFIYLFIYLTSSRSLIYENIKFHDCIIKFSPQIFYFFDGINFNVTIHLDIWHLVTKCLACCLIYTRCIFHVDIFFNVHIFLCVFIMNNHLSINAHVPINSQII